MQTVSVLPAFRPAKGTLLHRQLFLVLRDRIVRGEFSAGGALPKEEDLCAHFGVSRITVRRALADLAAAGLVTRRHGLGTFVREGLSAIRPALDLSLMDELRTSALETDVNVLKVEFTAPSGEVGESLRLAPGERAVHALRLRSIDGVPVMLTDAWVHERFRHSVTAARLRKRALYEILLDQGIRFGRVVQELSAIVADAPCAGQLKVEFGAPLLRLTRIMHDGAERPILHLMAFVSSERSRIVMDITGETVNTVSGGRFVHDAL